MKELLILCTKNICWFTLLIFGLEYSNRVKSLLEHVLPFEYYGTLFFATSRPLSLFPLIEKRCTCILEKKKKKKRKKSKQIKIKKFVWRDFQFHCFSKLQPMLLIGKPWVFRFLKEILNLIFDSPIVYLLNVTFKYEILNVTFKKKHLLGQQCDSGTQW